MPIWAKGPVMPGTMGKHAPRVKGRGRGPPRRRGWEPPRQSHGR